MKKKQLDNTNDIKFQQKLSKRKKAKKIIERVEDEDRSEGDVSLIESLDDDYSDLGYYKDIYNSMRDW